MGLEIGDRRVRKEGPDQRRQRRPLDHISIDHHVVGVERAQRDQSALQHIRNLIHEHSGHLRPLAHKDRMAGAVWRTLRLVNVVDQQDRLANRHVDQFNTIRKPRNGINHVADDAVARRLEVFVLDAKDQVIYASDASFDRSADLGVQPAATGGSGVKFARESTGG
eukprot:gene20705-28405_t